MIFKLCYLFTFITSMMNLLGFTNLEWKLIFTPSVLALLINVVMFIITFIIFVFCEYKFLK